MSQVAQQIAYDIGETRRNEIRQKLQQWIPPTDLSVNYNTACDAHHEGTVTWCTQSDTFASWTASGSLLWIHGKPGSGKSVISSVIIRDIKTMSDAGSACVAYFYFDFKDTGKQDLRALTSSLLVQLSNQSNRFFDVLVGLYSTNWGIVQPANSLVECLKKMLIISQVPIYLILDALDECPNDSGSPSSREEVLAFVKELVELRLPYLHLCITSRSESDIRTALEPLATQQLSLQDESGHKQDIVDYVTFVVRSDQGMKIWRDDDKDAAIEKLTEKADGIFQSVFYQLEALRNYSSDVRRVLEDLPETLEESYERVLKKIDLANEEHAYRLLQCLAVAVRPLQVEELADVLAFDFSTGWPPKYNADWRWEDQGEAALSACSHLVSVISNNGSRVVQFSNLCAKEFLTSDRLANSIEVLSRFHILIEPSHATLAKACLGVLIRLGDCTDKKKLEQFTLARYAGQYWVRHAQVGDVESRIVDVMDHFLDTDKPHFTTWARIQCVEDLLKNVPRDPRERMEAVPHPAAPLYFAVERGFSGLAERLVVKYPQQVNARGGECGAPLHAAVHRGCIEVARLLVAHGADVNSRFDYGHTPLEIASEEGHLEVAEWLLDSGAEVNPDDKKAYSPLHLAAASGHLEVVRMLLSRRAEVKAAAIRGYTPLFSAVESGNPDIVQLLLDHGADLYARANDESNALHVAAGRGRLEVAQMLLARNVDVNARNDSGMTPLLKVLLGSRKPEVVRLLLDHGADTHVCDIADWSALHHATGSGNPEIVQMILERNPDIEAKHSQGDTPLMTASCNGNPAVVQLLLDHGADPQARDKLGNTALDRAAGGGSIGVCRMLLKLNVPQTWAFLGASSGGDPDLMRLLLEHGADANMRNDEGSTALHLAAGSGSIGSARFLVLEVHADVNAQDKEGWTPLHHASQGWIEGTPEIVQLLLENGAEVHARNNSGETALELACGERVEEIVELLSKYAAATA